jgi:hypothetical protein
MANIFDMNLGFLGELLSLEGFVKIGVSILAIVVLYLVVAKYAESAKNLVRKLLPSFGFTPEETTMFSEMAPSLVKTAGFATILLIAGRHIPLISPLTEIGSFILTILGYAVSLTIAVAIVYLARSSAKNR